MLKFFLNNCRLDVGLLADMVAVISLLTQERPLRHGELTLKDVKTLHTFNDVLGEYVMANLAGLQDGLASTAGQQLNRLLKEAIRNDPFSEAIFNEDVRPQSVLDQVYCQDVKLVLDYLLNVLQHTVLSQAPYQMPRFDIGIRVTSSSSQQAQAGQGPGILGTSAALSQFYFAVSKKGGALGNFPAQVAKIHETLLTQFAGADPIPPAQGSPSGSPNELPDNQPSSNQSCHQQYRSLTNSALRNVSRVLKLDLLLFPFRTLSSVGGQVLELSPSDRQIGLYGAVFHSSYLQSLIQFQRYMVSSGSFLFIAGKDAGILRGAGREGRGQSADKDNRKRFYQSAVTSSVLALRSILNWQKAINASQAQTQGSFHWGDLSFFDLAKLVLEQMLSIVVSKMKMIKVKQKLRTLAGQAGQQEGKTAAKVVKYKAVAYLLAHICDLIDVLSAPSGDPRIKAKLNQNSAMVGTIEILERFLAILHDSFKTDPEAAGKHFMSKELAEHCLQVVAEVGEQFHFEARKMEQRLKLSFVYSFIQAKYAPCISADFDMDLQQYTLLGYRRSLEIAQANKNINGVLEAFKKLVQGSLQLAITLRYKKSALDEQDLQEHQSIMSNVVKPILQDQELKRFIFTDLG